MILIKKKESIKIILKINHNYHQGSIKTFPYFPKKGLKNSNLRFNNTKISLTL